MLLLLLLLLLPTFGSPVLEPNLKNESLSIKGSLRAVIISDFGSLRHEMLLLTTR
jgi:hypothetical protein